MGTTKSNLGSYLASEGLRPEETDFGFVFKYQNLTFFIFWDDDDNQYLKLALPSIYNVDDNNREDAIVASNEVNIEWKVIKAVVQKMTSGTTLLSNYGDIMESLEGMFATSLTGDEISKLVKMQLNDLAQWNIQSYAVTGKNGKEITYSMPGTKLSVMYPDEGMVAYGSQLIQKVLSGETLTEADMTYHK